MDFTGQQLKNFIDMIPGVAVMYIVRDGVVKPLLYTKDVPGFAGLTEKEYLDLYGNNAMNVVLECDRPEMEREMGRIFSQQQSFSYVYRTYHKTKGFIWTHADARLIGTFENCPVIFSTFSEVNADFTNNTPGGILVYTAENEEADQFYFVSHNFLWLLGYTEEEFRGRFHNRFSEMLYSEDREKALSEIQRQLKEGSNIAVDFRVEKKNGSLIWMHGEGHVTEDRSGKKQHYMIVTDITASVTEKDSLAERTRDLEVLINNIPVGIIVYEIHDDKPRFTAINKAACNVLRVSSDIMAIPDQTYFAERLHPDDRDYVYQAMGQLAFTGRHINLVFRYSLVQNDYKWLRLEAVSLAQPDNGKMVISVITDISAEKEAEQNLNKRRETERKKFHDTMQALLSVNQQALCTFQVNITTNRCFEGFGSSPYIIRSLNAETLDGLIGNILEMIPNKSDKRMFYSLFSRMSMAEAFRKGQTQLDAIYRRLAENGVPIWVHTTVNMALNPLSNELEAVLYSEDFEERKNDEAIIQHITDEEYDFIATLHTGDRQFYFRYVGKSLPEKYRKNYCRIGVPIEYSGSLRFAMKSWINHAEWDSFLKKTDIGTILKHLSQEDTYFITVSGKRGDGSDCWKQISFSWLDGLKKWVLIEETDITSSVIKQQKELVDRLHTEQSLRLEADKANEMKSGFLLNVSHDMRTPLNAILGYDMLAKQSKDIGTIMDYLKKIGLAGETLLSLVNDTLDLQKIEYGTTPLNLNPVNFGTVMQGIRTTVQPMMDEKNIRFEVAGNCFDDVTVLADAMRIEEIFINLLSNAAKFTPAEGQVLFSAECLSRTEENIFIRFLVKDNGIGISKEFLPRIFEPFAQERTEKNADIGGSGLGLSIVKRLVEKMEGTIEVASEPEKGTTFVIYLNFPFAAAENGESENISKSTVSLEGKRMLLCEDNSMNREIARAILEQRGIKVDFATNGKNGVEKFLSSEKGFYDAILMDIRMPVMDGYLATNRIRSSGHPDAGTIPVIAMTADAYADDVEKALQSGMNGHISKPVDPDVLFNVLQEILEK